MKKVSIVIPAFNEAASLGRLLEIILQVDLREAGFEKEIIVVDNGSQDETLAIAQSFPEVRCFRIEVNRGKGEGTKHGIAQATGDYVLIQDADLEYDPHDYLPLLQALEDAPQKMAVYGSRILGERSQKKFSLLPGKHQDKSLATYIANTCLSLWCWLLFGRYLTDTLTGYKVYPMSMLRSFTIQTFGFETDHELTAKLLRSGAGIMEVPVSYHPRSVEEGKKIRAADFFIAIWTFLKFRFVPKSKF